MRDVLSGTAGCESTRLPVTGTTSPTTARRCHAGLTPSGEFHDHGIDGQAVARLGVDLRRRSRSRSARSTFSIFIASTTASVSPALTSCPSATAIDTTRPGIGQSSSFDVSGAHLHRHQPFELGGARQHGARGHRHALPGDAKAVGDRPDLRGDRAPPTVPRQIRSPGRQSDDDRQRLAAVDRQVDLHRDGNHALDDGDREIVVADLAPPSRASARPNAAPAGRSAGRAGRGAAVRPRSRSTASTAFSSPSGTIGAKPSGYSSAMKPVDSRPSRQRGCCISAARNGMLCSMPSTTKLVERFRHGVDGLEPGRRPGAELGDHRIVEHRDLRAFGDAGVVADDDVAELCLPPAAGSASAGRSTAGSCDRDPRHRAGFPPPSRSA